MLASGSQDCGSEPGQSHWIFRAKKSTACLPLEGKQSRLSHVADMQHLKEPRDLREILNRRPY
jgi:hypothetical protein